MIKKGIDWDGNDTYINEKHYLCSMKLSKNDDQTNKRKPGRNEFCRTSKMGTHECIGTKITYNETIPLGGPHRPGNLKFKMCAIFSI